MPVSKNKIRKVYAKSACFLIIIIAFLARLKDVYSAYLKLSA